MPRQRSKKLSISRQTEQSSALELRPNEDQSDSDNDSPGMWEKDEEEEELERLVLGDGAGFKAQLGQHMDLDGEDGSEFAEGLVEEGSGAEAGLEDVDDAEVSSIVLLL
jgi:U3 small nucleolar RNA-associated protein 18